jgi:hypothetical protein
VTDSKWSQPAKFDPFNKPSQNKPQQASYTAMKLEKKEENFPSLPGSSAKQP